LEDALKKENEIVIKFDNLVDKKKPDGIS
jgi:hypothetical protein